MALAQQGGDLLQTQIPPPPPHHRHHPRTIAMATLKTTMMGERGWEERGKRREGEGTDVIGMNMQKRYVEMMMGTSMSRRTGMGVGMGTPRRQRGESVSMHMRRYRSGMQVGR